MNVLKEKLYAGGKAGIRIVQFENKELHMIRFRAVDDVIKVHAVLAQDARLYGTKWDDYSEFGIGRVSGPHRMDYVRRVFHDFVEDSEEPKD